VVCGGHWEGYETNCRFEDQPCNPHPCNPPPPACACEGQNNPYEDADGDCVAGPPFGDDCNDGDCSIGGGCSACDNNGVCEYAETASNCPSDCSGDQPSCNPQVPGSCCGNQRCDGAGDGQCPEECDAETTGDSSGSGLCPQDSWSSRFSRATPLTNCSIEIRTVSVLNHSASHPNCGSQGDATPINARASMSTGLFGSCSATDENAFHARADAGKDCQDLSEGYYTNRGTHYYDGAESGTSASNLTWIRGCGGDDDECSTAEGCEPGYTRDTGNCNENVLDSCGCCQTYSPIVIDLAGDGVRFSSAEDGALWDTNGLGHKNWVGWPLSPDDVWLALDRNGNGRIDSGLELFGNTRTLSGGGAAANGYEALRDFDLNADGVIDSADPVYSRLRLWSDADRNGVSEPAELTMLPHAGVVSIGLDYRETRKRDQSGNLFRLRGSVFVSVPLAGRQQPDAPDRTGTSRSVASKEREREVRARDVSRRERRDSYDVYPATAPALPEGDASPRSPDPEGRSTLSAAPRR
jgi:hypothetical protein